jgi:hypothetical protein
MIQNKLEVFNCLIGSQNYNLDDETSDRDYKRFVLPDFDDIYYNRALNTEISNTTGINFYKSIKELPNLLFKKASFNNLEMLYSTNAGCHDSFNKIYEWMIKNRDNIFKANFPRLYDSTIGETFSRIKNVKLSKSCPSTVHLVKKYGYDTKDAMHGFRAMLYIDMAMEEIEPSKIIMMDDDHRQILLDVKNGLFDKDECISRLNKNVNNYSDDGIKDYFHSFSFNKELYQEFDAMIKEYIRGLFVFNCAQHDRDF